MSTTTSWSWAIFACGSGALGAVSYFGIENPARVVSVFCRLFFSMLLVYTLTSAIACVFRALWRFSKPFPLQKNDDHHEREEYHETKQHSARENLQRITQEKAEEYQERILEPREKARLEKQEKHLRHVLEPLFFTGKGEVLGGDERLETSRDDKSVNEKARKVRRFPAHVQEHIPAQPTRRKRVIVLPEEPEVGEDVVMVTVHTLQDERRARRFHLDTTMQVLFDYMTTLGYNPHNYTLAWLYPRQTLPDEPDVTLSQLQFGRRTLLFVQERELM